MIVCDSKIYLIYTLMIKLSFNYLGLISFVRQFFSLIGYCVIIKHGHPLKSVLLMQPAFYLTGVGAVINL